MKKEQKKEKHKHAEKGLKQEVSELKETLQRLQAEFENSRKRMEKERQVFSKAANASLVKELLPLLDSIDAAEMHLEEQQDVGKEDAVKGIESIKRQLLAILKSEGLEEIKALPGKFDPMLHECVLQSKEKGKEDEDILEEIQKGYLFNGNVLRHSRVKVNKL
jgi:molecular chaperone GrpE